MDGLSWLPKLFDTIYVSKIVKSDVLPGTEAQGEGTIVHAFEAGWLQIWQEPIKPILDIDLDAGETDCINIAKKYTDQVLLVMDERAGRSVARSLSENRNRSEGNLAKISFSAVGFLFSDRLLGKKV